ncbi:Cysteine-rich DPF motif domain-containing protein 1 [Varanus komodoensis]|nr:Cysteine-rich DPF motif domain-containing protein 1 [Varanus komodoensis]
MEYVCIICEQKQNSCTFPGQIAFARGYVQEAIEIRPVHPWIRAALDSIVFNSEVLQAPARGESFRGGGAALHWYSPPLQYTPQKGMPALNLSSFWHQQEVFVFCQGFKTFSLLYFAFALIVLLFLAYFHQELLVIWCFQYFAPDNVPEGQSECPPSAFSSALDSEDATCPRLPHVASQPLPPVQAGIRAKPCKPRNLNWWLMSIRNQLCQNAYDNSLQGRGWRVKAPEPIAFVLEGPAERPEQENVLCKPLPDSGACLPLWVTLSCFESSASRPGLQPFIQYRLANPCWAFVDYLGFRIRHGNELLRNRNCWCCTFKILLEECYVMKDPFTSDKGKFLLLGSRCSLCCKRVCVGTGCKLGRGRQKKKRKIKDIDCPVKEATGLNLEQLSRGVTHRTFWRPFTYKIILNWRQLDST